MRNPHRHRAATFSGPREPGDLERDAFAREVGLTTPLTRWDAYDLLSAADGDVERAQAALSLALTHGRPGLAWTILALQETDE
jgi:hypothetical protein